MPNDDLTPEEFLQDIQPVEETAAPKMRKSGGRKIKKTLLEGEVEGVELRAEEVTKPTSKFMKVLSVTRTSDQRIAHIELRVKDGTLYEIEIDEATARGIAGVFDEAE